MAAPPAPINYTNLNNLSAQIKNKGIGPPGNPFSPSYVQLPLLLGQIDPVYINKNVYIDITKIMRRFLNDKFNKRKSDDLMSDAVKDIIKNSKLFVAIKNYLNYTKNDSVILYFTHLNANNSYPNGVLYIYDFENLTSKIIP